MSDFLRKIRFLIFLDVLTGCASPAIVFVSRSYNPNAVRRVALLKIADYPGLQGSGEIAASTFEKYLLWGGYSVVERRQVDQILQEQSLDVSGAIDQKTIHRLGKILGVDALVLGSLTDFSNARDQTVMVDIPQEQSEPIYGHVITEQRVGDTKVTTEQKVVTGYNYIQTDQVVPEIETLPAQVGLAVRLVDTQTGEMLWSASATADGVNLSAATEQASSKIMQTLVEQLKKASKEQS